MITDRIQAAWWCLRGKPVVANVDLARYQGTDPDLFVSLCARDKDGELIRGRVSVLFTNFSTSKGQVPKFEV